MNRTYPVMTAMPILFLTLLALSGCVTGTDTSTAPASESTAPPAESEDAAAGAGEDIAALEPGTAPATEGGQPERDDTIGRAPQGLPFRVLAEGPQSAVRVPVTQALTSPAAFRDAWAAIHANLSALPPVPEVDFSRETVVVLLLGERRSGGYGVHVQHVTERRDSVTVTVSVSLPAPGSVVTMALTSPYQIVAIQAAGKRLEFDGDDVAKGYSPYD